MSVRTRALLLAAATATSLLSAGLVASAAQAQVAAAQVPAKYAALAASSTPKLATVDAKTGRLINLVPLTGARAQAITVHNPCQTNDACWVANSVPYANYGFAGTGTKTGSYPQRANMYTHAHTTVICWRESPRCSPTLGPNSIFTFTSYPVTGTKVTNYS